MCAPHCFKPLLIVGSGSNRRSSDASWARNTLLEFLYAPLERESVLEASWLFGAISFATTSGLELIRSNPA